MNTTASVDCSWRGALGLYLMLLAGCSGLTGLTSAPSATPPSFYSFDLARSATAARATPATAHTLVVNTPQAAAGYDSQRIIYVRQPHKLEYFAHNEWVDPPARMLAPLIVAAVEASGAFRAVVSAPGSASGELRLETEVLQLQHEFGSQPSRVRFVLRAYLAEDGTRRVVATRDFEAVVTAPSDDPYGGVQAANAAVRSVLENLAAFCAESAAGWQPSRRPSR